MKSFIKYSSLFGVIFFSLTSCQKVKISKHGYFSTHQLSKKVSRSIASVQMNQEKVDAKQILIYCFNKDKNLKRCFNKHARSFKLNTHNHSFHKTQKDLKVLTQKYLLGMENNLNRVIHKREKFCNKNSLYNYTRCLKMNSLKSTMELLNESQKQSKLNGNEYLYLKREIKSFLDKKFEEKILARLTE